MFFTNMRLLVVCLMVSCLTFTEASFPKPASGRAKENVQKDINNFAEAFNSRNMALFLDYFTDDCVFMPPHETACSKNGTEPCIKKTIKKLWTMGMTKVEMKVMEVYTAGELAIDYGMYKLLTKDNKEVDDGKYLMMSKKEGSKWKIHYNMWNTNRPTSSAPGDWESRRDWESGWGRKSRQDRESSWDWL